MLAQKGPFRSPFIDIQHLGSAESIHEVRSPTACALHFFRAFVTSILCDVLLEVMT